MRFRDLATGGVGEPEATPTAAATRSPASGRWTVTLVEAGALLVLAVAYTLIRAAQGEDVAGALAHSRAIAEVEHWLIQHLERPANSWLASIPALAVPACYFYAVFHYAATPLVLYRSWRIGGWVHRRGYWTLILASAIALVIYARFPVAPPRLLPDLGMIDVMRAYADYGWWGDAASAPRGIGDATNQYAAMPSLHFGWSLWCAIQMWSFPGSWWRVAAVLYPSVQVLVVIATANHYLLDVLAGGLCVLVALGVVVGLRWLRGRHSAEPVTATTAEVGGPKTR
ncbi:phosphatase PAP2 family protein [Nocardioides sp. L-11A]|uniref:phosphatase PAP2 family protein n=1 Tax=Nocardioides sp. L-11A TaxID=3043848 RepID=UPI00249C681B|nr:phosphatase PAP2 family protein [Nocardioides sp. L-11A]